MKITVKFSELKHLKKLKELGKFFEQNQEFVIELDKYTDTVNRIESFTEEIVHFLFRFLSVIFNKKISVIKEEKLIKEIVSLIISQFK